MSEDESAVVDADVPEDDAEAGEGAGVAEIEMEAGGLTAEDAQALDEQTLESLDDDERAELEEIAAREPAPAAPGFKATPLSRNFNLSEFHCCRGHCTAEPVPSAAVPALRRLVTQVLQPMRDRFGTCTVHSGYRNAAHNGHVGGEPRSHHRYDMRPSAPAADVSFARGNVEQWATEARRRLGSIGGIGRYPSQNFVHVDQGPLRKWSG